MPSTRARAHAPWSASKVQTALRCPQLFHYRYVERMREPETMPEQRIGKAVHTALEHVLTGAELFDAIAAVRESLEGARETAKFDAISAGIQPFVDRIDGFRRKRRVHRQLIEFSLAIRDDGSTTQFYASDAYYRGILDVAYIYDDDNLAVIDHKTGIRFGQRTIAEQLEGYAVLAASYFRTVRRVWMGIHWVAEHELEWADPVTVEEIAGKYTANVMDNIEAAALAVSDGPRPNPGVWCERCGYRTVCPSARETVFEPVDDEEPHPGLA